MLRVDNNARLVVLSWTLPRMFTGRYAIASGKRILDIRWKRSAFDAMRAAQQEDPVPLLRNGKRMLWYFHDNFY